MKLYKTKLALAASLIVAGNVYAQSLPNVIVTAKPDIAEVEIDKFSSTSAVITDETIRDLHAADLASALRNTPGTQISRYNPVGSYGGAEGGSVFIRGMGLSRPGSEIKTYIDNVPMYMPTWNHALLDLLPVNGMRDITIYKSPQPQVTGNNFASINMNTKTAGPNNGISGNARVSYGSYNTVIEQVDMAGRNNDIDYSLAQGYSKSDGQRANASGQLSNIMGALGMKLDRNWSVGVSGMAINNTAKDPGNNTTTLPALAPSYDSAAQMVTAFVKHSYDAVEGEFRFYSNTGKGNINNDNTANTGWGTENNPFTMQGFRWKENITPWKDGTLLLGLDYDSMYGSITQTNRNYTTTAKTTLPTFKLTSPYVGLSHNLLLNSAWSLVPSAGVRTYQNNYYASKTAPYGGLSLVSDTVTVFANASKGVNYPGLEGPALGAALSTLSGGWHKFQDSWRDLSPEENNHMEVGAKVFPDKKSRIDLSLFQDTISNRYGWSVTDNAAGTSIWTNYGKYTTQGVELSGQREIIPELSVFGGWTYLNNDSTANLPYVPQNAFNAAITGYVGKFRISVDGQYQTSFYAQNLNRQTTEVNNTRMNGFGVANARVSYPIPELGKKGEVFVMVENIFNQQYSYRQGYPMPGTWGSIGLSASFN
jgi:iron complex outermembrane receptor protein